jgi:hypothetical protein
MYTAFVCRVLLCKARASEVLERTSPHTRFAAFYAMKELPVCQRTTTEHVYAAEGAAERRSQLGLLPWTRLFKVLRQSAWAQASTGPTPSGCQMDADLAFPYPADGLCQLDGMPGSGLLQVSTTDDDPSIPQGLDSCTICQLLEDTQTIRPQDGGCFDTSTDLSSSSSPSSVAALTPRQVDDKVSYRHRKNNKLYGRRCF